ncbi:sigma-70 family RNA polymerase sigma factor [Streptomyces sp. NPDC017095]|uniref:sigma-70 family RNA polymerase sigma factor n=1 Tax=Streptomyces sp. NPDC017095 TaxID=3364977 RepID=UPI0037A4FB47
MAEEPGEAHRSLRDLRELYERGYPALVGYARKKLREAEVPESFLDAEDVVQNAFAKSCRDPSRIDEPRAYVYQLIRREVLESARRRRHARDRAVLVVSDLQETDFTGAVEDRLAVRQALMSLPARQRAAVYVVKGLGYRQEEAALLLGKRPGTVAAQVARAGAALKTVLTATSVLFTVLLCGLGMASIRRYGVAGRPEGAPEAASRLLPLLLWALLTLLLFAGAVVFVGVPQRRAGEPDGSRPVRPVVLRKRLAARLADWLLTAAALSPLAVQQLTAAYTRLRDRIGVARASGETATVWLADGATVAHLALVGCGFLLTVLLLDALPTALWGRTLGKKLLGLRVADIESGRTPSYSQALRRVLASTALNALVVPGIISLLWGFLDRPWRQCWPDKAAGTTVTDGGGEPFPPPGTPG